MNTASIKKEKIFRTAVNLCFYFYFYCCVLFCSNPFTPIPDPNLTFTSIPTPSPILTHIPTPTPLLFLLTLQIILLLPLKLLLTLLLFPPIYFCSVVWSYFYSCSLSFQCSGTQNTLLLLNPVKCCVICQRGSLPGFPTCS